MILFIPPLGSQLGNRLFNLAALDKLCSGRRIGVLFGCGDLHRHFHWRRPGVFIPNRGGDRVFRLLQKLSRYGLARRCSEGTVETEFGLLHNGELVQVNGSRSPLIIVEKAFLQSDVWMRDDFPKALVFREPTASHQFGADKISIGKLQSLFTFGEEIISIGTY